MHSRSIFALTSALLVCAAAVAQTYKGGDLLITQAFARSTVPGQTSGAAYLSIENKGKAPDKLIGVASPAAKSVQIHTMAMDGNVMKMREATEIALQPATKVAMQPGDGYHIMLIGLKKALKAGDKFPLTLNFEKSGKVEVAVPVENH